MVCRWAKTNADLNVHRIPNLYADSGQEVLNERKNARKCSFFLDQKINLGITMNDLIQ